MGEGRERELLYCKNTSYNHLLNKNEEHLYIYIWTVRLILCPFHFNFNFLLFILFSFPYTILPFFFISFLPFLYILHILWLFPSLVLLSFLFPDHLICFCIRCSFSNVININDYYYNNKWRVMLALCFSFFTVYSACGAGSVCLVTTSTQISSHEQVNAPPIHPSTPITLFLSPVLPFSLLSFPFTSPPSSLFSSHFLPFPLILFLPLYSFLSCSLHYFKLFPSPFF